MLEYHHQKLSEFKESMETIGFECKSGEMKHAFHKDYMVKCEYTLMTDDWVLVEEFNIKEREGELELGIRANLRKILFGLPQPKKSSIFSCPDCRLEYFSPTSAKKDNDGSTNVSYIENRDLYHPSKSKISANLYFTEKSNGEVVQEFIVDRQKL